MQYVITIKPVKHPRRDRVRQALRFGLPEKGMLMGLWQAHDLTLQGGQAAHTSDESEAQTYAIALKDAGAVVTIEIES